MLPCPELRLRVYVNAQLSQALELTGDCIWICYFFFPESMSLVVAMAAAVAGGECPLWVINGH
jgi:hypothetical protein